MHDARYTKKPCRAIDFIGVFFLFVIFVGSFVSHFWFDFTAGGKYYIITAITIPFV